MSQAKKIAYSYQRFSSGRQGKGTSLKRQAKDAVDLCKKNGWFLDETYFVDRAKSGFSGDNVVSGALGQFLESIGPKVQRGSVLIVESLDRLSRQEIHKARKVMEAILEAGVEIATTSPERHYTAKSLNDPFALIEILFIQARANEESEIKSKRSKHNWSVKRELAKTKTLDKGHRCPGWLKFSGKFSSGAECSDSWVMIPPHKKVVQDVFTKCINGWGIYKIVKWLNKEEVLTFSQNKKWTHHAVQNLLRDKAAIGEISFTSGGKHLTTLKDYYPKVVSENVFYQAQAALDNRTRSNGKVRSNQTTTTNLFTGIAFFGKSTAIVCDKGPVKYILAHDGLTGAGEYQAFPYTTFEKCFLRELRELKQSDLSPVAVKEDKVAILTGKLRRLESDIQKTKARIKSGQEIDTILDLLTEFDREKKDLTKELENERSKEHKGHELQEVKKTLDDWSCIKKPDMRIRLKSLLRGLIDRMELKVEWTRTAKANIIKKDKRLFVREGKKLTLAVEWCKEKGESLSNIYKGIIGQRIKEITVHCCFRSGDIRVFTIQSNGTSKSDKYVPLTKVIHLFK